MSAPVHSAMTAVATALERASFLDKPASAIGSVIRGALGTGPLKDAVSGTWLGHALHPLLTDTVIGTWSSALLLDLIGGEDAEDAATKLLLAGVVMYPPTALTGGSDWSDSMADHGAQRVGLVHAAVNATALTLQLASLLARRSGDRSRGVALSLAAGGALGVGGWLGGHMTYSQGVDVDQTTFDPGPEDWTPAVPASELVDGEPMGVDVAGTPVLLVRSGAEVWAIHDRCSHRGCPLSENLQLEGPVVECTCHGSRFDLRDGSLQRGPALYDQPSYEVRELDGHIELRLPGN